MTEVGELLRRDYDWPAETAAITAPVLLVFADADSVRPAHVVEFYQLLGGGQGDPGWDGQPQTAAQLAVLPGHTHYGIASSPALAGTALAFLDAEKR